MPIINDNYRRAPNFFNLVLNCLKASPYGMVARVDAYPHGTCSAAAEFYKALGLLIDTKNQSDRTCTPCNNLERITERKIVVQELHHDGCHEDETGGNLSKNLLSALGMKILKLLECFIQGTNVEVRILNRTLADLSEPREIPLRFRINYAGWIDFESKSQQIFSFAFIND